MSRNNRISLTTALALACQSVYAQQVANLNPVPPGMVSQPSSQAQPAREPVVPLVGQPPVAAGAVSDLTVKKLSDLQREKAISEIQATIRTSRAGDRKIDPDKDNPCSVANYQLIAVYGMSNKLRADIVLCGTAILTVQNGNEVGDGWKVTSIQTSHLTVSRGKAIKQIWMPIPKEQLPTASTEGGARSTPMSLPPLPPNLAPSPYRAIETPGEAHTK